MADPRPPRRRPRGEAIEWDDDDLDRLTAFSSTDAPRVEELWVDLGGGVDGFDSLLSARVRRPRAS